MLSVHFFRLISKWKNTNRRMARVISKIQNENSRVITGMTCSNNCWTAMRSDKLNNQNYNGFRVYLNQPIEWKNDRAQTPSSPGNCTTRVKESATISRDLAEIILWKS